MGGPEELRRGNGRVKDPSGFVLDEFRIVLGVDFGANHVFFGVIFGWFLKSNFVLI